MANTKWDSKFNNTPFKAFTEADVIALVNKALSCGSAHATTYKYAFFKNEARSYAMQTFRLLNMILNAIHISN